MSLCVPLSFVLVLLLLPGCSFLSDAEDAPLVGTKWVLESISTSGQDQIRVTASSNYVTFLTGGIAQGRADCNTCRGNYTLEGSSLEVMFACTQIYCGPESLGDEFQLGLLKAAAYEVDGNKLTIMTEQGKLVLRAE